MSADLAGRRSARRVEAIRATKKAAPKRSRAGTGTGESRSARPRRPGAKAAAKSTGQPSRRTGDLLAIVEKSLDADKAEDIVAIDLAEKSSIADIMVIATGRNARQLAAMAQHLDEKLTKAGVKAVAIEGLAQGDWVLLDGGDIVVHLFRPDMRKLYNLEKMWASAPPQPEALLAVG